MRALAADLGCSERTVHRDLEVLAFAGVPWYFDPELRGYRVREGHRFPVPPLTDAEAFGQAVAAKLTAAPGLDVTAGAGPVTRKLAAASPDPLAHTLADAANVVAVLNLQLADHAGCAPVADAVRPSLLTGSRLRGVYASPYEPGPVALDLHPYRLCLLKRAWYLIARIEGEDAAKTFRLARFRSLGVADEPAEVPAGFSLRDHFGLAWAVYRGAVRHAVELRFAPEAAGVVTETVWHPTQRATRHPDGSATLRFTVDGLPEIAHWILRWTGRVRVVRPEALKVRVVEALERGLDLHAAALPPTGFPESEQD